MSDDIVETLERLAFMAEEANTAGLADILYEATDTIVDLLAALTEIAADASVPVQTGKNGINHKKMYKGWRKIATARIDIARAALADLKGEK